MVTWFVFFLTASAVCFALAMVVARLDGKGESWNHRGAEHLATMLTVVSQVSGFASIVTGAWSLDVRVTR